MTNKEILQADLLDILFEHRNKLYGAYALRKTYSSPSWHCSRRCIVNCFIIYFMSFINKKDHRKDDRRQR